MNLPLDLAPGIIRAGSRFNCGAGFRAVFDSVDQAARKVKQPRAAACGYQKAEHAYTESKTAVNVEFASDDPDDESV